MTEAQTALEAAKKTGNLAAIREAAKAVAAERGAKVSSLSGLDANRSALKPATSEGTLRSEWHGFGEG